MGVHQSEDVYAQIKEILGIPLEEPILIFRGQDLYAVDAINSYRFIAQNRTPKTQDNSTWITDLDNALDKFKRYRQLHKDNLKVPD